MLSQAQYAAAGLQGDATSGGGKIRITSTLRDRTPQPQPKPLDEGQFIWGKPSSFSWGSRSRETESGPYQGSTPDVTWPDYAIPQPDPTDDPAEGEQVNLDPILYEWKEIARVETIVRIDGPNGAYVDFARIDEVIFSIPPNSEDGRSQFVRMTFQKPT